jgi:hypothetical protein
MLFWIVLGTRVDVTFYSTKGVEDIIVISSIFREITSGEQLASNYLLNALMLPILRQWSP